MKLLPPVDYEKKLKLNSIIWNIMYGQMVLYSIGKT